MADISDLNEAARPKAPRIEGGQDKRHFGRSLAVIHAMHLRDLMGIRALVTQVDQDRAAAQTLKKQIADLHMTRNLRQFGALCGRACNHLFFHHDAEEMEMFPAVTQRGGAGFAALIAKLREEHAVIHHLLVDLESQAGVLVETPDDQTYAILRATFDRLLAVLRSHFHYEETELEEVLGVHAIL